MIRPLMPADRPRPSVPSRALVAFVGRTRLRWLGWLRPGFRHCFVVIEADGGCIVCDPMVNRLLIGGLGAVTLDMVRRYCWQQGYTVLDARIDESGEGASLLRPFTCVEFVKRALSLRAPGVFTPWQLFRVLRARATAADSGLDEGPKIGL